MGLIKIIKGTREYQSKWNGVLESIIAESNPADKFKFRTKNLERPGLGVVGYGASLFADVLDVKIDDKCLLTNSIIAYLCGIVDDEIDNDGITIDYAHEKADDFYKFFESGEGFEALQPFRDFLVGSFPTNRWKDLLKILFQLKEDVIGELNANSYDSKKQARVNIGRSYGDIFALTISSFSAIELSNHEKQFIRNYTIGTTIMDDVADYYQDLLHNQDTAAVIRARKQGVVRALSRGRVDAQAYFRAAEEMLGSKQRKKYRGVIKMTNLFYHYTFFKKMASYFLNPLIFTQYRVGKGGLPFKMFKIRTMHDKGGTGEFVSDGVREPVDYSKVTRLGRFLRRWWIDEAPQLFNVLRGEMSLVGPRAMPYDEMEDLPPDVQQERNKYKPAIADATVPLRVYQGMDKVEAERAYLTERKNSYFVNLRYAIKIGKAIITGKFKGL